MANDFITYDPSGVYLPEHGLEPTELSQLAPSLEASREEVLADAQLWADGVDVPAEKIPLDAGFHYLPNRLLAEYEQKGSDSEVGKIKATADRIAAEVDRVLVLGIGGSYMGARALLEACCHPYYNELPRPATQQPTAHYFRRKQRRQRRNARPLRSAGSQLACAGYQ